MGRKISDGLSVKVLVPAETTIAQGAFVHLGGFLGLAVRGVTTGEGETAEVVLNIESGEYETSQTNADDLDAMTAGADIFFDDDAKQFTTTPTPVYAGKITSAADADGVIWFRLAPQLAAATDAALLAAQVGDLDDLETTADTELVAAINEVKGLADAAQGDADTALDRVAAHQTDAPAAVGAGLPAVLLTGAAEDDNAILWMANTVGPGGNDITIDIDAGAPQGELSVTVVGTAITVTLADDGSTAAEVSEAVNEHVDASALVTAMHGDDSDGSGDVDPLDDPVSLAGGTNMIGVPSVNELNAVRGALNDLLGKLMAAGLMAAPE